MKKRGLFWVFCGVVLFMVAVSVLPAQDKAEQKKKVVTVFDFKVSKVDMDEMRLFIDYITSHIISTREFKVIDREQRTNMLSEIKFSLSGSVDETAQLEAGRLLSADLIVVGSLGKIGKRYLLNIKLIKVETGETIEAASKAYESLEELIDNSKELTYTLLHYDENAKVAEEQTTAEEVQPKEEKPAAKTEEKVSPPPVKKEERKTITPPPKPAVKIQPKFKRHSVETFIGYNIGDAFNLNATVGYLFRFTPGFYLGAYGGANLSGGSVLPQGGVKLVFGNKEDGFGFALDLGFYPGIGMYFKNLSINVYPTFIFDYNSVVMVDIGYSFTF